MVVSGVVDAALLGLLGLLVGSFLNVVIHRLPKMMDLRWAAECAEFQAAAEKQDVPAIEVTRPTLNLMVPRSRCPHCGHAIRWFENIPVLSYLVLKGSCSACHASISPRYLAVEAMSAALFAWCGWHWGLGWEALAWSGFAASVLALACICLLSTPDAADDLIFVDLVGRRCIQSNT